MPLLRVLSSPKFAPVVVVPSGKMDNLEGRAGSLLDPVSTLDRINAAVDYVGDRSDLVVVLSGGLAGVGDRKTSDALAMDNWLKRRQLLRGVRILLDEASRDTFENCQCTLRVLGQAGITPSELMVCTNRWHGVRFRLTFGELARGTPVNIIDSNERVPLPYVLEEMLRIPVHFLWPENGWVFGGWNRSRRTPPQFL